MNTSMDSHEGPFEDYEVLESGSVADMASQDTSTHTSNVDLSDRGSSQRSSHSFHIVTDLV